MNRVTLRGPAAELRWGYYRAAALSEWTLEGGQLSARVVSHDAFRSAQQSLTFVVPRPTGRWAWRVEDMTIHDGALTARVSLEP